MIMGHGIWVLLGLSWLHNCLIEYLVTLVTLSRETYFPSYSNLTYMVALRT